FHHVRGCLLGRGIRSTPQPDNADYSDRWIRRQDILLHNQEQKGATRYTRWIRSYRNPVRGHGTQEAERTRERVEESTGFIICQQSWHEESLCHSGPEDTPASCVPQDGARDHDEDESHYTQ